jgi:hypothetical protein
VRLRAAHANRGLGADEKRIRTKYTVMDKINGNAGVLFKIDDPRGRLFVRAKSRLCSNGGAIHVVTNRSEA